MYFSLAKPHDVDLLKMVHHVKALKTIITVERDRNRRPIIHTTMLKSNYVQFAPDALQSRIKPALLLVENVMLLAR